jgi:uncharacterized glyoxalase superfamily protein PhnB
MDFYREAFGAELLSQDTPVTCPWLRIGDLTITLVENTERISPLESSEHAMATLLLRVDDVNAAFLRATKHGARVIQPPDKGGVTFMVADPDGIIIEVMRYDPDA